ncbi:MAG: sensor histidine kinase [Chitinophagales bacterium]
MQIISTRDFTNLLQGKLAFFSYRELYKKIHRKLFTKKIIAISDKTEADLAIEVAKKEEDIKVMKANMQELHHRVANNFQLISSILSSQYEEAKEGEIKNLIRETNARIQAMMYVHRSLFNDMNVTKINMKEYIENLVENLVLIYDYVIEEIELDIQISEKELDAQKALHIGLIMNELVSNAFKYAFRNHKHPMLRIRLKVKKNQGIHLIVSDNGPGFNPANRREGAFGLKLIETLTQQLKGKATFSTQNGTRYELVV